MTMVSGDGCGAEQYWKPQMHVLAVDDSSIDRKLIESLLKRCSYKVTTAECGQKALEVLGLGTGESSNSSNLPAKSPQVNMIITDYSMPDMTGYDLLRRVKNSYLKEIPVVVVSSENVPQRIHRCIEHGAMEFLLKPLRQSDLTRVCSRMLQ